MFSSLSSTALPTLTTPVNCGNGTGDKGRAGLAGIETNWGWTGTGTELGVTWQLG